jgi:hypothetical protein
VKYFTSNPIGNPRCTSNWLKIPAFDFSSTASDRSVATISVRQPDSRDPASFRHIAIEYGSCPVEEAAHQIRKARRAARACASAGMTVFPQMVERNLVAEEERLVGGHRLDHLRRQRLGAALHLRDQFRNSRHAGLARDRQQPAFDQILLVGGQVEPGALFQKLTQILIV